MAESWLAQGPLARTLADKNTPPVARSSGYRMNMGMDAFESMFAKAKAAPRESTTRELSSSLS